MHTKSIPNLLLAVTFILSFKFEANSQKGFNYQEIKKTSNCIETYLDADSLPYKIQWQTNGKFDSSRYIDLNGNQVKARFLITENPHYDGGLNSFKSFFHDNFNKPKQTETNFSAKVLLVFYRDKLDVRILQRIGYGKERNFDLEIKRIILLTKEKWKVIGSDDVSVFEYFLSIP